MLPFSYLGVCMKNLTDLTVFEIYEVEVSLTKEENMYKDLGSQWDMVEEVLSLTEEFPFDIDENGNEVGADKKLNKPAEGVYTPSDVMELEADDTLGYVSDASLMIAPDGNIYEKDFNDVLVELYMNMPKKPYVNKGDIMDKIVGTDKQEDNLRFSLEKLKKIDTYRELMGFQKYVFNAQKEKYIFSKEGNKAFWDAYRARKQELWTIESNRRNNLIKEVSALIDASGSAGMLDKVSQEIYDAHLPIAIKKNLWSKLRSKKYLLGA